MGLLSNYFYDSGYLYKAGLPRIEELQQTISEEQWKSSDTEKLREWAAERRIEDFIIYKDDELLFDASGDDDGYSESIYLDPIMESYLYDLTFEDGETKVYLYEGAGSNHYRILLIIAVVIGFSSFLGIFLSSLKQVVVYIQTLRNEVEAFTSGDLSHPVTIYGNHELTKLAEGLDHMRISLIEKDQKEAEMRAAQKKMVLGMSHDLKTPLTGLLAYMEILKRQQEMSDVSREYLDKAYHQIIQMRNLSNRLFEYFLIDSRENLELEDAEDAESILGDYLSEFCALLESLGFPLDTDRLSFQDGVKIRINTDYMGRISNNLISNLEKYGDREEPVQITLQYDDTDVCLVIRNTIKKPNPFVEGSGIGTKNISMMMRQMGGELNIAMSDIAYVSRLYFPIANEKEALDS